MDSLLEDDRSFLCGNRRYILQGFSHVADYIEVRLSATLPLKPSPLVVVNRLILFLAKGIWLRNMGSLICGLLSLFDTNASIDVAADLLL